MNRILIISPHFPPSNLAAVHRTRLFALHLPAFGWEPVILTVDEKFYEEKLDWNLHKLLPTGQCIEKVQAFPVTKPRLIGDIGLRAFFQLRKKGLEIVRNEQINFVYIPIPSFYVSLIGPYLQRKTGVKYGIDYIDPWVHQFPGSDKLFSRHWWSTKIARWLEPKAVKKASLITGVAAGYYQGVIERNPLLSSTCIFNAMPYGGERSDHEKLGGLDLKPYLFKRSGKMTFIYAGAMLPKAYGPLEAIFKSLAANPLQFSDVEFHFIGTGKSANDLESYNIKPYAEKYGLWQSIIFEYPQRIPYLDVLVHLKLADAVFILGSTEPHYTPSKTYQAVLSKKPIMAVLHEESTAVYAIMNTNAGLVLSFNGSTEVDKIGKSFADFFDNFCTFWRKFRPNTVNMQEFDKYSAYAVTESLAKCLDQII